MAPAGQRSGEAPAEGEGDGATLDPKEMQKEVYSRSTFVVCTSTIHLLFGIGFLLTDIWWAGVVCLPAVMGLIGSVFRNNVLLILHFIFCVILDTLSLFLTLVCFLAYTGTMKAPYLYDFITPPKRIERLATRANVDMRLFIGCLALMVFIILNVAAAYTRRLYKLLKQLRQVDPNYHPSPSTTKPPIRSGSAIELSPLSPAQLTPGTPSPDGKKKDGGDSSDSDDAKRKKRKRKKEKKEKK